MYNRSHCEGGTKATNYLRQLLACLATGVVPAQWRAEYSSLVEITTSSWVADLAARAKALDRYQPLLRSRGLVNGEREGEFLKYWMGGMFVPHSFITATRQHSAQVSHIKFDKEINLIKWRHHLRIEEVLGSHLMSFLEY